MPQDLLNVYMHSRGDSTTLWRKELKGDNYIMKKTYVADGVDEVKILEGCKCIRRNQRQTQAGHSRFCININESKT